ncbi:MAG: hypothetical protein JWO19_1750 [Bryobacterales bacterium]|nr:hypothetical protein [Bryobacterales bacterium]
MIVAMVAMRMVQVAFHQVVRVVAVRNCFVSAVGSMFMIFLVRSTVVIWRT